MRIAAMAFVLLACATAYAQVEPETISTESMPAPNGQWVMVKSSSGYLFDSASGDMLGLLPLTANTPAITFNHDRGEIYASESHWSRTWRGEREDVLQIYDTETLQPAGEVAIPGKTAALSVDGHIGISGNGRFVFVYNMTPAQSVTVVDVEERKFASEVSTPGCGVIMPVEERSLISLCGDGTLQLIELDASGNETNRKRSQRFFNVQDDPILDRTTRTGDNSWMLISQLGDAFNVTVENGNIEVSDAWSLTSDAERADNWLPGGLGFVASHAATNRVFVLMHQGGADSHRDPGNEIWIFDPASGERLTRMPLIAPALDIVVTRSADEPRLLAATIDGDLLVFSAMTLRYEREIEEFGSGVSLLQGL